ncbi:MAG TPA: isoprenylcysteine carboxylmethyltransferase family protein [Candidatus Acidoferrales bacterium]|nr:isoprenylcysteine carboxylmethyltransferase family protein [Candidatus Acidoferrales bacterium]
MGWLLARTLVFTVVVPGSVIVLIPRWILRGQPVLGSPWLVAAGALLVAAGGALLARCFWAFMAEGRGTPAPWDPPRRLVVRGPFSRVRNPIYLGVLAVLTGEAGLFSSGALLAWAVIAALLFHGAVVLYEEPGLRRRFGADYERYLREVPRWVPRLSGFR